MTFPSAARSAVAACIAVAATLLVFQPTVHGQAPTSSEPVPIELRGTAVVRGRVTDASGAPLEGVTVRALARNRFAGLSSLTDAEGRYELRGLPAMSITIAASLPGHTGATEGLEALHLVTVREDEVRKGADLVLVRAGVVTGRVTGPNGEPLVGASVRLAPARRLPYTSRQLSASLTDISDDRGQYRVHGLPPGEYFLSVTPSAGPPAPQPPGPSGARGPVQVFYPGVWEAEAAEVVKVAAGSEIGADVAMPPSRRFVVSGRVVCTDEQLARRSHVLMRGHAPGGATALSTVHGAQVDSDGAFRFTAVPPGRYSLSASVPGERLATQMVQLEVRGDVANLELKLTEGVTVRGRVVFASRPPKDARTLQIYHRQVAAATDGWSRPPVMLGEDGRFEFKGLRGAVEFMVMFAPAQGPNSPAALAAASAQPPPEVHEPPRASPAVRRPHPESGGVVIGGFVPGTAERQHATTPPAGVPVATAPLSETHRTIAGVPIPVGWRVRALRVAGEDVTNRGAEVGHEGVVEGIEVEVAADAPVVTGIVRDELGHPYPGAMIVAISADARAAHTPDGHVRVRGLSIQNGRYFAIGLEPGAWDFVALAGVADPALIEDDQESIARLRRSATRVELPPSEALELDLRVVRRR